MLTIPTRARTSLALLAALLCGAAAAQAAPNGGAKLTPLARPPVWAQLDPYQKTVTREEFDSRLKALYATTPASLAAFRRYAEEDAGEIVFYADDGKLTPRYRLAFATEGDRRPSPAGNPVIPRSSAWTPATSAAPGPTWKSASSRSTTTSPSWKPS